MYDQVHVHVVVDVVEGMEEVSNGACMRDKIEGRSEGGSGPVEASKAIRGHDGLYLSVSFWVPC